MGTLSGKARWNLKNFITEKIIFEQRLEEGEGKSFNHEAVGYQGPCSRQREELMQRSWGGGEPRMSEEEQEGRGGWRGANWGQRRRW